MSTHVIDSARNRVTSQVCLALIRSELSGFRGYPTNELGEKRFAKSLQEAALTVGHAKEILSKFTAEFPTVQEIIDTGLSTRAQFEPQRNQLEQWRQECGEPQPVSPEGIGTGEELREMWRKLRHHFAAKNGGTFPGWKGISQREIYIVMRELGYPLTPEIRRWYDL